LEIAVKRKRIILTLIQKLGFPRTRDTSTKEPEKVENNGVSFFVSKV